MRKGPLIALCGVLGVIVISAIASEATAKAGRVNTSLDLPSAAPLRQAGTATSRAKVTVDTSWRFVQGEYGSVYITGVARNNTDRTLGYIAVSFSLFDGEGNQVGSAMDNVTNLAAGGTWKFKAIVIDDASVKSARLSDITAF